MGAPLKGPDAPPAQGTAEAILSALPNPVLMIGSDGMVRFANVAAEAFFRASTTLLCRHRLDQIVPFSSPLLSLVDQVRKTAAPINEYSVDVGTPRTGGQRTVDLQVAPVPELSDAVLIMLQPRTMAQKIDRQLTHRGAARSVSGMAAMLAHEIKNPLSGIRGAAQLLETTVDDTDRALTRLICAESDRVCALVDQMEHFSDERPLEIEPVNIHVVLDY
ncbi:MAG: two-component system sensor histidine kinase NtrB, partial [Hyphomicrobiales bacterium]